MSYNFTNFFPKASIRRTLGNGGNLSAQYSGSTRAPSIDQIQPIKDNSDLLNQTIGNPNLKQLFRQRLSASYDIYKLLSETNLYIDVNYTTVSNDFSTINYVDPLGRRISQPVNVQGNNSLGLFSFLAKKLKKPEIRLSLDVQINKEHNTNFINTLKNINNAWNVMLQPRVSYEKEKKFEISYSTAVTWVNTTSSIRPDEPTKYIMQEHSFDLTLFLPFKIEFATDAVFNIRQKTDAFDKNTNAIKWNMRLDRKLFKAAKLRLSGFDLLDQNIGFQRTVNSNFISERTYDTFRRYFLVSLIWNFNKNGAPQE